MRTGCKAMAMQTTALGYQQVLQGWMENAKKSLNQWRAELRLPKAVQHRISAVQNQQILRNQGTIYMIYWKCLGWVGSLMPQKLPFLCSYYKQRCDYHDCKHQCCGWLTQGARNPTQTGALSWNFNFATQHVLHDCYTQIIVVFPRDL